MALATVFAMTREDVASVTSTPQARGLMLIEQPCDVQIVTKLTGDTTGSVDTTGVQNATSGFFVVLNDSGGTAQATLSTAAATFTQTDYNTIALTGMGDWTRAILFVTGRNYD